MPAPALLTRHSPRTAPDMSSPSSQPQGKGQKPSPHRAEEQGRAYAWVTRISAPRAAAHHQTQCQEQGRARGLGSSPGYLSVHSN